VPRPNRTAANNPSTVLDGGGLPRPIWPEEPKDLAFGNLQIEAVNHQAVSQRVSSLVSMSTGPASRNGASSDTSPAIWESRFQGTPVVYFWTAAGFKARVRAMDASQPTPQVILRQMTIGELLDAAIKLYRRNWKSVITIAAVAIIPAQAIGALLAGQLPVIDQNSVPTAGDLANLFGGLFLLAGLNFIVTPFLTGALSWIAAKAYLGEEHGVGEAVSFAFSKILSLMWITILVGLSVAGGLFLLIIGAIIFSLRLFFAPTVLVVEGHKGTAAVKRSWQLSKGSAWRILGTLIVTAILTAVASFIVAFPLGLIAAALFGGSSGVAGFVTGTLANVLTTPFAIFVAVLLYFDTRIRKEGFDLSLMAQEFGRELGPGPGFPPPPGPRL
jgi:hypothetical protein